MTLSQTKKKEEEEEERAKENGEEKEKGEKKRRESESLYDGMFLSWLEFLLRFCFVFSYFLFVCLFSDRRNLILKFSSLHNDKYRGNPTWIQHVTIISLQARILGRINTVVCWYTPFLAV